MVGAEQRPMDLEYARLSIRTGHFARVADDHLGNTHFGEVVRAHRWHLTPDKLDGWKTEAEALGVPRQEMEVPPDRLDALAELGMVMHKASTSQRMDNTDA